MRIGDGNIIIYPTDTLYGFGVDATNTNAIKKLNRLKGRVQPLSIIIESIAHLDKYAVYGIKVKREMDTIFPGPYTALLPAKYNTLSPLVQNGSQNIGIRCQLKVY